MQRPLFRALVAATIAAAGAADAQTVAPPRAAITPYAPAVAAKPTAASIRSAIYSSEPRAGLVMPQSLTEPAGPAAFARTEIDHRFASNGVVGSVGYMCGIDGVVRDDNLSGGGPASTFGRQGQFLGARLGVSFK